MGDEYCDIEQIVRDRGAGKLFHCLEWEVMRGAKTIMLSELVERLLVEKNQYLFSETRLKERLLL